MVGTHVTNFSNLIDIGERIDADMREGKIFYQNENRKDQNGKKKGCDVSFVETTGQSQAIPLINTQGGGGFRQARNSPSK